MTAYVGLLLVVLAAVALPTLAVLALPDPGEE